MPAPDLDFRRLRKHRNSLNDGFEELTRQLVRADPPPGWTEIENRGPGADGGVEILVRFAGDRVWGWQSKFFDQGFGSSEAGQLRTSFSAALATYPGLDRYRPSNEAVDDGCLHLRIGQRPHTTRIDIQADAPTLRQQQRRFTEISDILEGRRDFYLSRRSAGVSPGIDGMLIVSPRPPRKRTVVLPRTAG